MPSPIPTNPQKAYYPLTPPGTPGDPESVGRMSGSLVNQTEHRGRDGNPMLMDYTGNGIDCKATYRDADTDFFADGPYRPFPYQAGLETREFFTQFKGVQWYGSWSSLPNLVVDGVTYIPTPPTVEEKLHLDTEVNILNTVPSLAEDQWNLIPGVWYRVQDLTQLKHENVLSMRLLACTRWHVDDTGKTTSNTLSLYLALAQNPGIGTYAVAEMQGSVALAQSANITVRYPHFLDQATIPILDNGWGFVLGRGSQTLGQGGPSPNNLFNDPPTLSTQQNGMVQVFPAQSASSYPGVFPFPEFWLGDNQTRMIGHAHNGPVAGVWKVDNLGTIVELDGWFAFTAGPLVGGGVSLANPDNLLQGPQYNGSTGVVRVRVRMPRGFDPADTGVYESDPWFRSTMAINASGNVTMAAPLVLNLVDTISGDPPATITWQGGHTDTGDRPQEFPPKTYAKASTVRGKVIARGLKMGDEVHVPSYIALRTFPENLFLTHVPAFEDQVVDGSWDVGVIDAPPGTFEPLVVRRDVDLHIEGGRNFVLQDVLDGDLTFSCRKLGTAVLQRKTLDTGQLVDAQDTYLVNLVGSLKIYWNAAEQEHWVSLDIRGENAVNGSVEVIWCTHEETEQPLTLGNPPADYRDLLDTEDQFIIINTDAVPLRGQGVSPADTGGECRIRMDPGEGGAPVTLWSGIV